MRLRTAPLSVAPAALDAVAEFPSAPLENPRLIEDPPPYRSSPFVLGPERALVAAD